MNVAIVNHHDFRSNSGIHVFNLANRLAERGMDVTVYVPGDPGTVVDLGDARFDARPASDAGGASFDLVHAWTPRDEVRRVAELLTRGARTPYVVHLEDNEDVVATWLSGIPPHRLRRLSGAQLQDVVGGLPAQSRLQYRGFVSDAGGVTAVIDRLLEFAPPELPAAVFWPAYEPELFHPQDADAALRADLGIGTDESVIVYAGNTHAANADEVRALYLAVGLVNSRGRPLRLVRLGDDHADFLGGLAVDAKRHEARVPHVPRADVPRYLALADVLVQPGRPDAFNDYRFPAKLPEFLAMGKPVILPATNIGLELRPGDEALLLRRGDALELAQTIEAVLADPELRVRLGRGARRFAETRLSWDRAADVVADLYATVLSDDPDGGTRRRR